jgi:hypothetical protein
MAALFSKLLGANPLFLPVKARVPGREADIVLVPIILHVEGKRGRARTAMFVPATDRRWASGGYH